jgi:hypothetical protein
MTTKKTPSKKSSPKAAKQAVKSPPKAVERASRWCLGVFNSAAHDGTRIVAYVRTDGTVVPYLAAKVKTKKALFHAVYRGMRYAEAREQVLKNAAKAGVK